MKRRILHTGHVFVLPYLILLVAFGVVPAVYALLSSVAVFERGRPTFFAAGPDNYVAAFTDFRFWPAAMHVGQYVMISLPLMLVGVAAIALLLHSRNDRLGSAARTIYFVPGAVAGPTVVLLAIFMLDPRISPFAPIFAALGMDSLIEVARPDNLPALFAVMAFFAGAGGWIAILYGGLNGISHEIIEAAIVDGAGPIRVATSIKLPLVRPYFIYMLILTFAANVQLFAEPQLMDRAPGIAVSPYWSLNQLGYAFAFEMGDFGRAAAVSVLMLGIGLVGALAILKFTSFFRTDVSSR